MVVSVGIAVPVLAQCFTRPCMTGSRVRSRIIPGPATVSRVLPGLLDAMPFQALGPLNVIAVVRVRGLGPRQLMGDDVAHAVHFCQYLDECAAPITKANTRPPLYFLSAVAIQ